MEPDPTPGQSWREAPAHQTPTPQDSNHALPPSDDRQTQARMTKGRKRNASADRQVLELPQVPMLDVEAALKEITLVPAAAIHRTAAFAWASRAIACYRVCAGKAAVQEGLSYLYLGEHYREAALAHASMGEAWQPLFAEIDDAMGEDRARAFAGMRGRSPAATP